VSKSLRQKGGKHRWQHTVRRLNEPNGNFKDCVFTWNIKSPSQPTPWLWWGLDMSDEHTVLEISIGLIEPSDSLLSAVFCLDPYMRKRIICVMSDAKQRQWDPGSPYYIWI